MTDYDPSERYARLIRASAMLAAEAESLRREANRILRKTENPPRQRKTKAEKAADARATA